MAAEAEGAATRTPPAAATPSAVVGEHGAPGAAWVGVVLGSLGGVVVGSTGGGGVGRVPSGVPHPVSETSPLPDGLALPAFPSAVLSASLLHPSRRPNGYVPTGARARLSSRGREPFKAELRHAQRRILKMIQGDSVHDSASLRRQIDQLKATNRSMESE